MSQPHRLTVVSDEGARAAHVEHQLGLLAEVADRVRSGETRSFVLVEDHGASYLIIKSSSPNKLEMIGMLEAAKLDVYHAR